jgi:hypothetical protein
VSHARMRVANRIEDTKCRSTDQLTVDAARDAATLTAGDSDADARVRGSIVLATRSASLPTPWIVIDENA